jgi:threonine/homoserine/homoserine lactone efflux protein
VGVLSGDLVAIALLATLSVVGLGVMLEAYPVVFFSLRILGAAYVLWLGWSYLRPVSPPQESEKTLDMARGSDGLGLWFHSFGVGISNPKAVLFFAALFPQFIPAESGPSVLALLVLTFVVAKLVVLGGYAIGARYVVRLFHKPEHARRGRVLTGLIFVAFGVIMIGSALTPS